MRLFFLVKEVMERMTLQESHTWFMRSCHAFIQYERPFILSFNTKSINHLLISNCFWELSSTYIISEYEI